MLVGIPMEEEEEEGGAVAEGALAQLKENCTNL